MSAETPRIGPCAPRYGPNSPDPAPIYDPTIRYGYERSGAGVRCLACSIRFDAAEGSIMRAHARKCPVEPRSFPIPGVCDA